MFTKLRTSHSSRVVDVDRHVDRPVVELQGTHRYGRTGPCTKIYSLCCRERKK